MSDSRFDYFLDILQQGSITRAAEKNYISQPSMTQYLNRLEKSLGETLFDRSATPLRLTKAGEAYLDYAKKSMHIREKLEKRIGSLRETVTGEIRLGIPIQMQTPLMNGIVTPFLSQYPLTNIQLYDNPSPTLERELVEGRLDCALIYVIDKKYRELKYVDLEDGPVYLICNRNHPLAAGKTSDMDHPIEIGLDDVSDEEFLLLNKGFILRTAADNFFLSHAFIPTRITTMTSMNAVINMTLQKGGMSFMLEFMLNYFNDMGKIAFLRFREGDISPLKLVLAYNNRRQLSPPAQAFINHTLGIYHK